jgi:hypothetical protein
MTTQAIAPEQHDILTVANEHTYALTMQDQEVVRRITYRLSKWGVRGDFVTYREAMVLERIEIKLQSLIDRYRLKKAQPLNAKKTKAMCRKLLADLELDQYTQRGAA